MRRVSVLAVFVATGLLCAQAQGANIFTGAAGDGGLWSTGGNWDDGSVPASGALITIGTVGGTQSQAILDSNRTVGGITFNSDADFLLTYGGTSSTTYTLTLNNNSVISLDTVNPHFDTISAKLGIPANLTFSVTGGSTLYVWNPNSSTNRDYNTVNITGLGETRFWCYYSNNFQNVNIAEGATMQTMNGASYRGIGSQAVSTIEGTLTDPGATGGFTLYRGQTLLFRGTSGAFTGSFYSRTAYDGNMIFDNSQVNNNNRFTDGGYLTWSGNIKLIGNDLVDSVESMPSTTAAGSYGPILRVEVNHGAAANAELRFSSLNTNYGGMITIAGLELNGTGAYASRVFATGSMQQDNGIAPYARIGNEFATRVASGGLVQAFTGDRVGSLPEALTGTYHVLITDATTPALDASKTIASLKIAGGSDIDLGTFDLTLGGANYGGGLIQTGTAVTISHGRIIVTPGGSSDGYSRGWLFTSNDNDLTISADVKSQGIAKVGTGKLTFSGAIDTTGAARAAAQIAWNEGTLDYASPTNAELHCQPIGDGQLILDSGATLSIMSNSWNRSTGGVIINAGTLRTAFGYDGGERGLGQYNVVTVNAPGTLLNDTGNVESNVVLNGGKFEMIGKYGSALTTSSTITVPTGQNGYFQVDWTTGDLTGYAAKTVYGLDGGGTLHVVTSGTSTGMLLSTQSGQSPFTGRIIADQGAYVIFTNGNQVPAAGMLIAGTNGQIASTADTTVNGAGFGGVGVINSNGNRDGLGNAIRTLTSANSAVWSPGIAAGTAGLLTVNGHLTFSGTGQTWPSLNLDLVNGNGASAPVAGVGYDQLRIATTANNAGNLNGLANLNLNVNIAAKQNWLGDVMTVMTSFNNLTGQSIKGVGFNNTGFADVTVSGTLVMSGTAVVGQLGWVTLSNISYPGDANRDGITDMSDYIIW
ncbi:MAG: beta strand repeat-containing protein, partial [Phycisphaerae bacterium]